MRSSLSRQRSSLPIPSVIVRTASLYCPVGGLIVTSAKRVHKWDVTNTYATVVLTISLTETLCCFLWHPQLNKDIPEFFEDTVVSTLSFDGYGIHLIITSLRFPDVTLFPNNDQTLQATLLNQAKYLEAWLHTSAPICDEVSLESLWSGGSCNCSWSPEVRVCFNWKDHTIIISASRLSPSSQLSNARVHQC